MLNDAVKNDPGFLIILSAPSGCGKTSTVDRLLKRHPDWTRSISVTTRPPRTGEKDGVDYFFVSEDQFGQMEKEGLLLESARVFDRFYGTPKKFVMDCIGAGKKVILAIDVQGAESIKQKMERKEEWMSIFILPPSIKILRERLEGRKTETPEQIDARIAMAQEEVKAANLYEFTVMNQNLEQTVFEVEQLIQKYDEKRRTQ